MPGRQAEGLPAPGAAAACRAACRGPGHGSCAAGGPGPAGVHGAPVHANTLTARRIEGCAPGGAAAASPSHTTTSPSAVLVSSWRRGRGAAAAHCKVRWERGTQGPITVVYKLWHRSYKSTGVRHGPGRHGRLQLPRLGPPTRSTRIKQWAQTRPRAGDSQKAHRQIRCAARSRRCPGSPAWCQAQTQTRASRRRAASGRLRPAAAGSS